MFARESLPLRFGDGNLFEETLIVGIDFERLGSRHVSRQVADARRKLYFWKRDHNHHRPHSAFADRTPAKFAAICSSGEDGDETALKDAPRLPLSHRTTAATEMGG